MLQLGKGVKQEKADKVLQRFRDDLVDGEVAWFFCKCNNFRPMLDAVVITNARVLGLQTSDGFKFRALLSQLSSVQCDEKKGTVQLTCTDGQTITFKSVPSEDIPAVRHYLEAGQRESPPREVTQAVLARGKQGSSVVEFGGPVPTEPKAAKRARKEALKTADEEQYGRMTATGVLGGKTVRIYDKGYVRVGVFGGSYERLLSIEASHDVGKKTGVGRAAFAVATAGTNLLTSNKRGDVYLTIVTDKQTHVLHEEPPTARNIKQSKALEAAGQAVLRRLAEESASQGNDESPAASQAAVSSPAPGPTGAERLRQLNSLREEGLVTEDEFHQLRATLLGEL